MRYCRVVLVGLLLWLTGTTALCGNGTAGEELSAQEYAIFRLVLASRRPWSTVNPETMATVREDADWLKRPLGGQPEAELVMSFNRLNSKPYRLSKAFLEEVSQPYDTKPAERIKITLSRPGFDARMHRAMLILAIAYYQPEDVMNEGVYLFLEKKDGQWKIIRTAAAWDMRLGPTP